MGVTNSQTLHLLQETVLQEEFDFIIHVGDFAYEMWEQNGEMACAFFRQIKPLAAYYPYQVIQGNHEHNL